MTYREIELANVLAKCLFIPGSFDKRFTAHMATIAKYSPEFNLTPSQRHCLYRTAHRYRRQIKGVEIPTQAEIDELGALAEENKQ